MIFAISICILAASSRLASASLSPTFPVHDSTCAVKTDCVIKWQDTSAPPAASTLGETSIDLVTGDPSALQLAQTLGGLADPGAVHAFTFKPDSTLSPTAKYAIRFIPKSNPSGVIFSTFFTITGGDGTGKTIPTTSTGTVSAGNSSSTTAGTSLNSSSTTGSATNKTSASNSTSTVHNTTNTSNSSTSTAADEAKSSSSSVRVVYSIGLIAFTSSLIALL